MYIFKGSLIFFTMDALADKTYLTKIIFLVSICLPAVKR